MDLAEDLASEVLQARADTVLVVGVGDEEHGDDGVGPLVVQLVEKAVGQDSSSCAFKTLDAGRAPELETWRIRELDPDLVLFIDAVDFGCAAGDVALLKPEQLRASGFDTHRAPLRLTMQYVESELGAKCRLIAIQPRDVRLGSEMCAEVRSAAESVASLIADIFKLQDLKTPDGSEL